MKKINWAILISGWGRSAVKTLELVEEGRLQNHEIRVIFYENENNGILEPAGELGIPCRRLSKTEFESHEAYYMELKKQAKELEVDFLFLMGYKHIIREPLLSMFNNKIVNIHPSLLPSFRGKRAIQQAMDYGVKITGITTHLIDEEVDRGTILCQHPVPISSGESFEEIDLRFVAEGKKIIEQTFIEMEKYG